MQKIGAIIKLDADDTLDDLTDREWEEAGVVFDHQWKVLKGLVPRARWHVRLWWWLTRTKPTLLATVEPNYDCKPLRRGGVGKADAGKARRYVRGQTRPVRSASNCGVGDAHEERPREDRCPGDE